MKTHLRLVTAKNTPKQGSVRTITQYYKDQLTWTAHFAWFPTYTEDMGWIWFQPYQKLTDEVWVGGITGGWAKRTKAVVMFRTSLIVEISRQ